MAVTKVLFLAFYLFSVVVSEPTPQPSVEPSTTAATATPTSTPSTTTTVASDLDGQQQDQVAILKQINRVNDDGSYTFGYEAADGSFKIETRDHAGNVNGMFGFVDEGGELKRVSYTASNGTGYQTTGSPNVPPLLPPDDAQPTTRISLLPGHTSERPNLPIYIYKATTAVPRPEVIHYVPKLRPTPATLATAPTESEEIATGKGRRPAYGSVLPKKSPNPNYITLGSTTPSSVDGSTPRAGVVQVIRPRGYKKVLVKRPIEESTIAPTTAQYYSTTVGGLNEEEMMETGDAQRQVESNSLAESGLLTSGSEDSPDVYGGSPDSRPYPSGAYQTLFSPLPQYQRILQDDFLRTQSGQQSSSTTPVPKLERERAQNPTDQEPKGSDGLQDPRLPSLAGLQGPKLPPPGLGTQDPRYGPQLQDPRLSIPSGANTGFQDPRFLGDLPDPRSQDPRLSDPRLQDPRLSDPRLQDPRLSDPRLGNPRLQDPRLSDPRLQDPRIAGPRLQDPRYQDPRLADQRYQDPGLADPRYQDPRLADPRYQDPRLADPRYQDPRLADPRLQDPRLAGPRLQDPRLSDPRYQDPRLVDPRLQDPRYSDPRLQDPPTQDPRLPSLAGLKGLQDRRFQDPRLVGYGQPAPIPPSGPQGDLSDSQLPDEGRGIPIPGGNGQVLPVPGRGQPAQGPNQYNGLTFPSGANRPRILPPPGAPTPLDYSQNPSARALPPTALGDDPYREPRPRRPLSRRPLPPTSYDPNQGLNDDSRLPPPLPAPLPPPQYPRYQPSYGGERTDAQAYIMEQLLRMLIANQARPQRPPLSPFQQALLAMLGPNAPQELLNGYSDPRYQGYPQYQRDPYYPNRPYPQYNPYADPYAQRPYRPQYDPYQDYPPPIHNPYQFGPDDALLRMFLATRYPPPAPLPQNTPQVQGSDYDEGYQQPLNSRQVFGQRVAPQDGLVQRSTPPPRRAQVSYNREPSFSLRGEPSQRSTTIAPREESTTARSKQSFVQRVLPSQRLRGKGSRNVQIIDDNTPSASTTTAKP